MMIYLNQSMLQLYQTYKNFLVCVGVINIQNISEYLSGVWSDTYILQIFIRQKLERLAYYIETNWTLKI